MAISVMTWVWNHSRSRHGARLVLLAIADCASADGGNAWPSNAELRRKSGLGERAVQSAVAELVSLGELEVGWNDGPKGCNRYRVIMGGDPRNICTPANIAPPQNLRGSGKRAAKSAQAKPKTPAISAPPQILHEPPQILRGPPAISAPVTVLEPRANQQKTSSSVSARGTRIPDDFAVTPDMVAWAREHVPDVDGRRETERFVNYWRGAAGAKGRKADWPATWKNWMLRAEDDIGSRQSRPGRPAHQPTQDEFAQLRANWARPLDALEAGNDPR